MKPQKTPYMKRKRKLKEDLTNSIDAFVDHCVQGYGHLEEDDEVEDEAEEEVIARPANRLRTRR